MSYIDDHEMRYAAKDYAKTHGEVKKPECPLERTHVPGETLDCWACSALDLLWSIATGNEDDPLWSARCELEGQR